MKTTEDKVIKIYNEGKIQRVWEMDKHTHKEIRCIKRSNGEYMWIPDTQYPGGLGTLLGCEIKIVDEPGIRLALVYRKTENTKFVIV